MSAFMIPIECMCVCVCVSMFLYWVCMCACTRIVWMYVKHYQWLDIFDILEIVCLVFHLYVVVVWWVRVHLAYARFELSKSVGLLLFCRIPTNTYIHEIHKHKKTQPNRTNKYKKKTYETWGRERHDGCRKKLIIIWIESGIFHFSTHLFEIQVIRKINTNKIMETSINRHFGNVVVKRWLQWFLFARALNSSYFFRKDEQIQYNFFVLDNVIGHTIEYWLIQFSAKGNKTFWVQCVQFSCNRKNSQIYHEVLFKWLDLFVDCVSPRIFMWNKCFPRTERERVWEKKRGS